MKHPFNFQESRNRTPHQVADGLGKLGRFVQENWRGKSSPEHLKKVNELMDELANTIREGAIASRE